MVNDADVAGGAELSSTRRTVPASDIDGFEPAVADDARDRGAGAGAAARAVASFGVNS